MIEADEVILVIPPNDWNRLSFLLIMLITLEKDLLLTLRCFVNTGPSSWVLLDHTKSS